MKSRFYAYLLTVSVALLFAASASAQQTVSPETDIETNKRAQTGMKFLSTAVDARAAAVGGALTAETAGTSTSLFFNPASMAGMDGNVHVAFNDLQFITDIHYIGASAAFKPGTGNLGVFGVSVMSVDYGEFIGTIRANNEQGFVETGNYSPTALSVGFGYARSFSDRFSAGAQLKYAYQNIGDGFVTAQEFDDQTGNDFDDGLVTSREDYKQGTIAVDFGIVYATGFRSLVIGMSARNFSRELVYVRERFELPLTFQIGAAMNLLDLTNMNPDQHALVLHVDAARPRDFAEHIKFGLEYTFMDLISLRGGFQQAISEEEGISLGAGLHHEFSGIRVGADYAYTDWGLFGDVQRIGIQVGL